ncbi:Claudin domain-containing protein 2 [Myotis brandtii]|uniref:Claudin domain-containing protein 2 n=1 Tax=Myotis brandtii TaxID=109478 RepID=S7NBF7_MYOBR|nr:Claudin domain-containing protein 2 [Myotis brandtii]
MGVKRSLQCGGTLLGLLANIFTVLSTASNYWIRFPTGHSGLWQDCTQGTCSNMPCQCEAQAVQMVSAPQPPSPTTQTAPALPTAGPLP